MTDFYLCDFASIVTRNYPIVTVNFLGIDPNEEQVSTFFDLLESSLDESSDNFVLIANDTLSVQTSEAAKDLIRSGTKKIVSKYRKRLKAIISIVPEGVEQTLQLKLVARLISGIKTNLVKSKDQAQKLAASYVSVA